MLQIKAWLKREKRDKEVERKKDSERKKDRDGKDEEREIDNSTIAI